MELKELRKEIDTVDEALTALFLRRMALSREIGRIKAAQGLPLRVPEREKELLARRQEQAGELADYTGALYETILSLSRRYQEDTWNTD